MKCPTCELIATGGMFKGGICLEHDIQLQEAEMSVARIRREYEGEPELLAAYLPSAEHLVELLSGKTKA